MGGLYFEDRGNSFREGQPANDADTAPAAASLVCLGQVSVACAWCSDRSQLAPQHRLYLRPEPQGQGSLRPTLRPNTHRSSKSKGRSSKSLDLSSETTLDEDLSHAEDLRPILWQLAETVARRLRKAGLSGRGVTLKLKTSDFRAITRTRHLSNPTQSAEDTIRVAGPLLTRETDGRTFRLIGIGVHDLGSAGPAVQTDLFGAASPTEGKVDKALDAVREKFGEDAVRRGRSFGTKLRRQGPSKVELSSRLQHWCAFRKPNPQLDSLRHQGRRVRFSERTGLVFGLCQAVPRRGGNHHRRPGHGNRDRLGHRCSTVIWLRGCPAPRAPAGQPADTGRSGHHAATPMDARTGRPAAHGPPSSRSHQHLMP